MNKNKLIYTGLGIVFLIAAALNYAAIRDFAYSQAQVDYWLSFGVPILVDTFIAIAAYIALINKEQGESTRLAKSIVIVFTVGSIAINIMHYPLNIYGISMALLVPTVVLLSIELALQQMEIKYRKDGTVLTIAKLKSEVARLQNDLAGIEASTLQKTNEQSAIIAAKKGELVQHEQHLANVIAEIEAAKLQLSQAKAAASEAKNQPFDWASKEADMIRLDGMLAAGVGYTQAAKVLTIGESTARLWAKKLNGGSISKGEVLR